MTWQKSRSGNPDKVWKKGQSGNPGGASSRSAPIAQILSEHAPEAVEKLLELMRSEDQQIALAAVREILNRVYGKPPVAVGMDVDDRTRLYQVIAPEEAPSFEEWLESVKTYRH